MQKIVLVVDDNSVNLTMINGILSADYKVYAVDSGEDALELLSFKRPDLILLDVEMPVMNGIELFVKIKSNSDLSEIPIIFLTGQPDAGIEASAFRLGAADFIRKPVNDVVLKARVKMHLEYADLLKNLNKN